MSNSSLKWSALIYGRTYEVDFRLIAMPKYFVDIKDRIWAENHILATTQIPEKLSDNPRWSLFTNEKYCVFATTCMVRELFPNNISQDTKDITTDFRGRPLYAFIGYVAERDQKSGQFPPLPAYSDLKLEQFQLLYQKYLQQCWDVKPYQPESKQPISTNEEDVSFKSRQIADSELQLNQNLKKIRVWSQEYNSDVWNTVIQEIEIFPQPISLCLGLSTPRDAENTPFLNVTILKLDTSRDGLDLDKYVEKERPQKNLITNLPSPGFEYQKTDDTPVFKHEQDEKNKSIPKSYESNISYKKIRNLVFAIAMYAFKKQKLFDIDQFFDVAKAKIKILEESLNDYYETNTFDGFYDFVGNEYKQSTYDAKSFKQDLSELSQITAINQETLQKELEKSIHSSNDITNVINDISSLILDYHNKTRGETQQFSQGLVGFGFKKADNKDEQHSNNENEKSTEKKSEQNAGKKEWF